MKTEYFLYTKQRLFYSHVKDLTYILTNQIRKKLIHLLLIHLEARVMTSSLYIRLQEESAPN